MTALREPAGLRDESGTSLIETLIVGFAVMAVALPVLVGIARLTEASDTAESEARSVATWVARHGALPESEELSDVEVSIDAGVVHARSTVRVDLVALGGNVFSTSVSASFSVPISQYRSNR